MGRAPVHSVSRVWHRHPTCSLLVQRGHVFRHTAQPTHPMVLSFRDYALTLTSGLCVAPLERGLPRVHRRSTRGRPTVGASRGFSCPRRSPVHAESSGGDEVLRVPLLHGRHLEPSTFTCATARIAAAAAVGPRSSAQPGTTTRPPWSAGDNCYRQGRHVAAGAPHSSRPLRPRRARAPCRTRYRRASQQAAHGPSLGVAVATGVQLLCTSPEEGSHGCITVPNQARAQHGERPRH